MSWTNLVIVGGIGAAAGYLLLRHHLGCPRAALLGAGLATVPAMLVGFGGALGGSGSSEYGVPLRDGSGGGRRLNRNRGGCYGG